MKDLQEIKKRLTAVEFILILVGIITLSSLGFMMVTQRMIYNDIRNDLKNIIAEEFQEGFILEEIIIEE